MNRYTVNPEDIVLISAQGETADDFLERIRHKSISHYAVQVIQTGEWAEVKVFPEWKKRQYMPPRGEPTTDAKKRHNHKVAVDRLTRILQTNFEPYKDVFVTFTCDDNHLVTSIDEGFEMADRAVRRLKYRYKKAGVPLKAILKVEIKKAKDSRSRYLRTADGRQLYRPHLHIVMNKGVPIRTLVKAWDLGRDKRVEDLRWEPEGFLKLAAYLCKDTKEGRRKWNSTTNLAKPPPPKTRYSDKAGGKRRVSEVALNENLQREYFEQILPGYSFVQNETSRNEYNSGVYLHARLYKK